MDTFSLCKSQAYTALCEPFLRVMISSVSSETRSPVKLPTGDWRGCWNIDLFHWRDNVNLEA